MNLSDRNDFLESHFPRLKKSDYKIASPEDVRYNCVAWSLSDINRFWWPDSSQQYFWPEDLPADSSIDSFKEMYKHFGYSPCKSIRKEKEYEKIAIYAGKDDLVKHTARQLPSGKWTSKLGQNKDIEHDLDSLEGSEYGKVVLVMRRKLKRV